VAPNYAREIPCERNPRKVPKREMTDMQITEWETPKRLAEIGTLEISREEGGSLKASDRSR